MAQVTSRFTPDQVLEAGRRAEADGRIDYAIQFYRHLADYHPGTPQAAEASSALKRLGAPMRSAPEPPRLSSVLARQRQEAMPPPVTGASAEIRFPRTDLGDQSASATAPRPKDPTAPASPLPPPIESYRIGRGLAVVFSALGWLMIASGVAALGLGMVVGLEPGRLASLSGLMPPTALVVLTGPALILVGLAVVFWAQLASAVFATANATRDLAAIERAKAEQRQRS